jgi:hypothetical protein
MRFLATKFCKNVACQWWTCSRRSRAQLGMLRESVLATNWPSPPSFEFRVSSWTWAEQISLQEQCRPHGSQDEGHGPCGSCSFPEQGGTVSCHTSIPTPYLFYAAFTTRSWNERIMRKAFMIYLFSLDVYCQNWWLFRASGRLSFCGTYNHDPQGRIVTLLYDQTGWCGYKDKD